MHDHLIFGEHLRSEVGFPELPNAAGGRPRWTLRVDTDRARPGGARLVGETTVSGGPVRLYRDAQGWWLDYHDTGGFAVSADGARIAWCPAPNADAAVARLDVIGRVLAVALHAAGLLVLHGSAVALDDGVVAFLAPKFHGKSTLAAALVADGAALVTDDTLVVTPATPDEGAPTALPGVHHIRLWPDSAARVASEAAADGRAKHILADLPEERLARARLALAALYVVTPVAPPAAPAPAGDAPARRVRLPQVRAAVSLVRHAKLGDLLGGDDAAALFERATALAATVPVYQLDVVRDFARLGAVVDTIRGWHAAAAGVARDD
jgi:hypothetical protein